MACSSPLDRVNQGHGDEGHGLDPIRIEQKDCRLEAERIFGSRAQAAGSMRSSGESWLDRWGKKGLGWIPRDFEWVAAADTRWMGQIPRF